MKKSLFFCFLAISGALLAEIQTVDGVAVECRDGVCTLVDTSPVTNPPVETATSAGGKIVCKDGVCTLVDMSPAEESVTTKSAGWRLAHGYMEEDRFLTFLKGGEGARGGMFAGKSMWLVLLLVLLGGLAMNLTPCILPMVPVNLIVIGKSAARGAWYGAGIAVAYGILGILAAVGGMAFGEIQGSPWFNGAVAVVFIVLALSLTDVFFIDFSKYRPGALRPGVVRTGIGGFAAAFFMGALSAVLAGACVAPVLISVLLLTADLFAKGAWYALGLPFVMGIGMALPWPFAGAGLQVLPKPGAWMKRVNRVFAVIVFGFAVWYGYLAVLGAVEHVRTERSGETTRFAGAGYTVIDVGPEGFSSALAAAKRPVLVDCWASWCKNCTAMETGTLRAPRVAEALRGFTVIRLRAEEIRALRALPGFEGVKGLPAFVVIP